MADFEKNYNLCFLLKTLYFCQLLEYYCTVNTARCKVFCSRPANLLSFLMKKDNSQDTVSAKKSVKGTIRKQPRKTLETIDNFLKCTLRQILELIPPVFHLNWPCGSYLNTLWICSRINGSLENLILFFIASYNS